jgi:hypothetical protein
MPSTISVGLGAANCKASFIVKGAIVLIAYVPEFGSSVFAKSKDADADATHSEPSVHIGVPTTFSGVVAAAFILTKLALSLQFD